MRKLFHFLYHCNFIIPEGNLKDTILTENPVPEDLYKVEKLNNFLKEILMKKHKTNEQNIGNILEMLQRETIDVMGLLPKLRTISEKAKGERGRGQECSDINKTFAAL